MGAAVGSSSLSVSDRSSGGVLEFPRASAPATDAAATADMNTDAGTVEMAVSSAQETAPGNCRYNIARSMASPKGTKKRGTLSVPREVVD